MIPDEHRANEVTITHGGTVVGGRQCTGQGCDHPLHESDMQRLETAGLGRLPELMHHAPARRDEPIHSSEGQRWAVQYTVPVTAPFPPGTLEIGIRPCVSLDHAYAVLNGLPAYYSAGWIMTSLDGGATWHEAEKWCP
jgi:hypothetical protein